VEIITVDHATLFLGAETVMVITLSRANFNRVPGTASFVPSNVVPNPWGGHWLKRIGQMKFWCNEPPGTAGRPS